MTTLNDKQHNALVYVNTRPDSTIHYRNYSGQDEIPQNLLDQLEKADMVKRVQTDPKNSRSRGYILTAQGKQYILDNGTTYRMVKLTEAQAKAVRLLFVRSIDYSVYDFLNGVKLPEYAFNSRIQRISSDINRTTWKILRTNGILSGNKYGDNNVNPIAFEYFKATITEADREAFKAEKIRNARRQEFDIANAILNVKKLIGANTVWFNVRVVYHSGLVPEADRVHIELTSKLETQMGAEIQKSSGYSPFAGNNAATVKVGMIPTRGIRNKETMNVAALRNYATVLQAAADIALQLDSIENLMEWLQS